MMIVHTYFLSSISLFLASTTIEIDIIQVSEFISGLVIGILGLWLTMRGISDKKISVSQKVYPLFINNPVVNNSKCLSNLEIKNDGIVLDYPCLLTVDLVNSGNQGLENPLVKISNSEGIRMISGSIEDIPTGYEENWSIAQESPYSFVLKLDHINPKQTVKAHFLLEREPKEEISVNCSMLNLKIHRLGYTRNQFIAKTAPISKINLYLIIITAILTFTTSRWSESIYWLARAMGGYIPPKLSVPFVLSTIILLIVLNFCGMPQNNAEWIANKVKRRSIILALLIISMVILVGITVDTIGSNSSQQFVWGCIDVVLFSVLLRLLVIETEINK